MQIQEVLESWQAKRVPLVQAEGQAEGTHSRLLAMGRTINLDIAMTAELVRLGFPPSGWSISSALALVCSADRKVLTTLVEYQRAIDVLDVEEMALPTSEARRPVAATKARLQLQMLQEVEALGVPIWGTQISAAIAIIEVVCAEREVEVRP